MHSLIRITIHRGANQIGGCITEIATGSTRIMIDLGSNLPGSGQKELTAGQVAELTKGVDAILYTHYHGDHIGLYHLVPPTVPQYMGQGALEVMQCKIDALAAHADMKEQQQALHRMHTYRHGASMMVGDIRITPYACCHSAFDSYMFKIEAEGKVILHTGDFRRHGYMGKGLDKVLRCHIGQVDVLITEGTMLSRPYKQVLHENGIKLNTIEALRRQKYVFALCSSTDMERLATFHAACRATGRVFLCDTYQTSVVHVFTKYATSPLFDFQDTFQLINFNAQHVKAKLQRQGFLMPIRASHINLVKAMMEVYDDTAPYLIYSMWQGYHHGAAATAIPAVVEMRNIFHNRIYDGTRDGFHTSGHADRETLQQVCSTTSPRIGVIAIHKEAGTSYQSLTLAKGIHLIEKSEVADGFDIRLLG